MPEHCTPEQRYRWAAGRVELPSVGVGADAERVVCQLAVAQKNQLTTDRIERLTPSKCGGDAV